MVQIDVPFSVTNLVSGKNPFEGMGGRLGEAGNSMRDSSNRFNRDLDIRVYKKEISAS